MSKLKPSSPLVSLSELGIRPYAEGDELILAEIEQRVHTAPWLPEHFIEEAQKPYSKLWVLTDEETDSIIYGYLVYRELDQGIEIINVAVDTPFQKKGFASFLVGRLVQKAISAKMRQIVLEVRKSNHAAVMLYQKWGFEITRIHKGYYSNGEDAYQMSRDIHYSDPIGTEE